MVSSIGSAVVVFLFAVGMGLFGLVGVVDPELAFRLQNLFQVDRVELTQFGRAMHYYGGLVAIVLGLLLTVLLPLAFTVLYVAIVGGSIVYLYRDMGRLAPN